MPQQKESCGSPLRSAGGPPLGAEQMAACRPSFYVTEGKEVNNMAGTLMEVRGDHPCPICGKPDWCARVDEVNEKGQDVRLILCKRSDRRFQKGTYAVQEGFDGRQYILIGNGPESAVYEDFDEWRALHQKTGTYKVSGTDAPEKKGLVPKDTVEPRDNQYCSTIYRGLLDQLTLDPKDRTYLRSKGFNDSLIEELGCRSLPENDYLRRQYHNRTRSKNKFRRNICKALTEQYGPDALKGVPGFYETAKWGWDIYGFSGILFPMYDIDGDVYRLRIRRNYLDVNHVLQDDGALFYVDPATGDKIYVGWGGEYTIQDGRKVPYKKGATGKYRTLSSWEQDREAAKAGWLANRLRNGCRSGNVPAFYGLNEQDRTFWFITEGEPKAALASKLLGSPCVSVPGVDSYRLVSSMETVRAMMEHGARNFVVAYDADKVNNASVLAKEKELCQALKALNVPVFIADWDINKGKGIDDALCAGASLKFRQVF